MSPLSGKKFLRKTYLPQAEDVRDVKDGRSIYLNGRTVFKRDEGLEECCDIAKSMIEEIESIRRNDEISRMPSENGKLKGSFRRKLMRRIKSAGGMAT